MKWKMIAVVLILMTSACDADYYMVQSISGNLQMQATFQGDHLSLNCIQSDSGVCFYTVVEKDCTSTGWILFRVETCADTRFYEYMSHPGENITHAVSGSHWYYCANDVDFPDQSRCKRSRDNRGSNGGQVFD